MSCDCGPQRNLQIIKAGFLKKYKKGFLSKGFKAVYAELTKDCRLLWYRDQTSYKKVGYVELKDVCNYLAVGPYTRSIPGRPCLPRSLAERHLVAVPSSPSRDSPVHWFICSCDQDLNDWMICISHVLPPPPPVDTFFDDGKEFPRDPPPSYSGSTKDRPVDVQKASGDSNGEQRTTEKQVCTTAQPSSSIPDCVWGWTCGWGAAWGLPGWNYLHFGPSIDLQVEPQGSVYFQETNGDLAKNGDLQTDHQECQMSDQYDHQADFETPDADTCYDACDPTFDATFDLGGAFDAGFSIGF